jgi:hypothetical protein
MTLLDDRLHDTVTTMLRAAPEPRPFESLRVPRNLNVPTRPPERRRNLVAAALAMALVAVTVLCIALLRDDETPRPAAPAPIVHEVWTYRRAVRMQCPRGPVSFEDRATIETWFDRRSRTFRRRVTAPIDTIYDFIQFDVRRGDPSRFRLPPTYVRGTPLPSLPGCFDPNMSLPSAVATGWSSTRDAAEMGRPLLGLVTDSRGRPAQRRQDRGTGTITGDGSPMRVTTTLTNFLTPRTGRLLEQRSRARYEGVGTVSTDLVRLRRDLVDHPQRVFSTEGFQQVQPQQPVVEP